MLINIDKNNITKIIKKIIKKYKKVQFLILATARPTKVGISEIIYSNIEKN